MSGFSSVVMLAPGELQVEGWLLPFDVVSDIMATSPPSTISALMKTCRSLYAEGPKHLLCDGVQLNRPKDIASFANFMLTEDPSSRFAHLRKLVLTFSYPSYQARFTELLVHPSFSLDTLVLRHTNDFLEQSESRLREAFRGFKTIKHMTLFGVQEWSAEIIQRIPSPLESLSISITGVFRRLDIAQMLRPFSNTLHTLLVNSTDVPVHALFQALRPRDFARVRVFGIVWDDSVSELLTAPAFALAFPAIKHLQLIPSAHPSQASTLMVSFTSVTAVEELRVAQQRMRNGNLAKMLQDPPPRPLLKLSPPAIEECSGELSSVYKLGLNCTLTTLHLWPPFRPNDLPTLRAVLEETRPRCLCLPTTLSDLGDLFDILHALQTQAPARIDLRITTGSWVSNFRDSASDKNPTNRICSILEPLFARPPPHGLVELDLLFEIADRDRHRSRGGSLTLGNIGEAFTRWASTVTPALAVSWRFSQSDDEEGLRWPDVGQSSYEDDNSDDYSDGWGYDPALPSDGEDWDGDHAFLEADGDEYDSDQWRRWDDDD